MSLTHWEHVDPTIGKGIKRSISLTFESKDLLAAFILLDLSVYICLILLRRALGIHIPADQYPASLIRYGLMHSLVGAFALIESIFLTSFIHAGLHGLVFLRMNSRKTGFESFRRLSVKNFGAFLYINIVMMTFAALSGVAVGFVSYNLAERYASSCGQAIFEILSSALSFVTSLLFVFAYPLVIVGFFARNKLKPIRTSVLRVVTDIAATRPIICILLIQMAALLSLRALVTGIGIQQYTAIPFMCLNESFALVVLVYSFLLITEHFPVDFDLDFRWVERLDKVGPKRD